MNRRKMMKLAVLAIGTSTAAVLGVPALMHAMSPALKQRARVKWRPLGKLEDFTIGEMERAIVDTRLEREFLDLSTKKEVYVWRKANDDVIVYSPSCTDLGCPVNFDKGSECFFCPCHGGIFSKEGERMAGPPKFPLYRYDTRILDGFLEIDLSSVPLMV